MALTREDYDADGEFMRQIAERFVDDYPDEEVRHAVGRGATTDEEFERWRWAVLAPYARQAADRCESDVGRLYAATYTMMFEQQQLAKDGSPPDGSPEAQVWAAALAIVKAALYLAHGRDSMLAFTIGGVVIDSMHPREEQRRG